MLIFGRELRAPIDMICGIPQEERAQWASYDVFTEHRLTRMNEAYTLIREHLGRAAERMKDHYDMRVRPAVFTRGQWVWYHTPRRYVGRSTKWQRMYTGPFLITRVWGPVDVVLQPSLRSKPFVAHVDKLRPCKQ